MGTLMSPWLDESCRGWDLVRNTCTARYCMVLSDMATGCTACRRLGCKQLLRLGVVRIGIDVSTLQCELLCTACVALPEYSKAGRWQCAVQQLASLGAMVCPVVGNCQSPFLLFIDE
jgi:hypothetical protein